MKATSTFLMLDKKYQHFGAPTVKISVEGKELTEKLNAGIESGTIELTSEYQASGCNFTICNAYEEKETSFSKKLMNNLIQLGSKVSVSMGYIKTEEVFKGYISDISYCFDSDEHPPYIKVSCMDVKGLMMKNQHLKIMKEDSVKMVLTKMLSAQPYSSFISGKEIDESQFKKMVISAREETDYDFAVKEAKKSGYEFFVFKNKVYFRKPPEMGVPLMKMAPKNGLLSADVTLSSSQLVQKVTVKSVDPVKNVMIEGSAKIKGSFSKTSAAKKITASTEKVYYEPEISTKEDAKKRAEIIIDQHQGEFGTISCTCIGIPEIVPGRFIDIDGLFPLGNNKYYITDVSHIFNDEGYTTTFEARIKKL